MKENKPIGHIIAGLLIAGVLIIYSLSLYITGVKQAGIYNFIPFLLIMAGLILFIRMFGQATQHQLSFGNLFSYGFKSSTVLTLVMVFFSVVFLLLFPDIKEKLIETTRLQLEEQGKLTREEIDKSMETWQNMFWVITIGGTVLTYAIVGAIGSALGAAITSSITKKKPAYPQDQLDNR